MLATLRAIAMLLAAVPAPPATVPAPKAIDARQLPEPFGWPLAISSNRNLSLQFHVDLDLLAPLGTGSGNAAAWLRDFTIPSGARLNDWTKAQRRTVTANILGSPETRVLPPNDPLLHEAEPWVDQATCSFYPSVFPVKGPETPVANLLMTMTLGRSWIARGLHDGNVDDLRRTMRLGRLLRQDDVTLIQELIGVALIRMSATAMYEMARAKRDTVETTLASLAIADATAIRLETMNRTHVLNAGQLTETGIMAEIFGPSSRLREEEVDNLVSMAEQSADRRFRFEAMGQLYVARNTAGGEMKKKAAATLDALEKDRDPIIAANARWYASAKWNPR